MYVLDLFSGIGGFSLGLERAGFQTAAFCEINPFCHAVLRKHWPTVPIFGDVRALSAESLSAAGIGAIDLICGGYPCQPFSAAGKRRGEADDRHLWPEMFRLICELRPTWIIGENVAGHITMGLDDVLSDLENAGYTARAFVIPACAVGAPHRRERVWIVAHSQGDSARRLSKRTPTEKSGPCQRGASVAHTDGQRELQPKGSDQEQRGWTGNGGTYVADTNDVGRSQMVQPVSSRQVVEGPTGAAKYSRFTGGRQGWLVEPSVGRVADGVPNRVDRIKSLGNGLVSEIPEILGQAIQEGLVI